MSCPAGARAHRNMVLGAKAGAAMDGRGVADLNDVSSVSDAVLQHRLLPNFRAKAEGKGVSALLEQVGTGVRTSRR